MKKIGFFLGLFLSFGVASKSQIDNSTIVEFSYHVVGMGGDISRVFVKTSGRFEPIQVGNFQVSKRKLIYKGEYPVKLYRRNGSSAANDDSLYSVIGAVVFPIPPKLSAGEANGEYMLMLGGSGSGVYATAISDDVKLFPLGALRVVNTMPLQCAVKVNSSALTLAPGASDTISLGASDSTRVRVAIRFKGAWVEAANNTYATDTRIRKTVFIVLRNSEELRSNPAKIPSIDFFDLDHPGSTNIDATNPSSTGEEIAPQS